MATGTILKNMVLLWENPSPNTAWGTGKISFSDDYDLYLMIYRRDASHNAYRSILFLNGESPQCITGSGYYGKLADRTWDWQSGGGLQSNGGYEASSTLTTNICYPIKIYGIKA